MLSSRTIFPYVLLLATAAESAPVPKLVARRFDSDFLPASLSNGFIGLRPGANPLIAITAPGLDLVGRRGAKPLATVVAGFVRSHPIMGVESWAPAPYPLAIDIKANRVSMQTLPNSVQVQSQSLDMANGELETEMTFLADPAKYGVPVSAKPMSVGVRVVQFVSRSVPTLICQRILLTPTADTALEVDTRIDTNGIPGTVYRDHGPFRNFNEEEEIDRVMGFRSDRSKLGIALAVAAGSGMVRRGTGSYSVEAKAGQTYEFVVFAAMVSEAYDAEPDLQAMRVARWGQMLGWAELRNRNQAAWSELWKSRVEVDGDPEAQRALDAAFYYLHANSHPTARTGVPAYGFSQYEGYSGHVHWDMDSWMFPPALLSSPATAKGMLEFRLNGLKAARARAASFGYQGAQYPWEAGTDGSETCWPVYITGWAEQHIVPDVAIAFWEYQTATQDQEFLHRGTWPVLEAIAEWIASRGHFTARGFEIDDVLGPDEGTGALHNGSYMNSACKLAMKAAIECARLAGAAVPEVWERIAREIVIPVDPQRGFVVAYDGAIAAPGHNYSIGMLPYVFLHGLPVSEELFRKTYEFEEDLRLKTPSGGGNPCSPNSPAFVCPAMASAAAFFGDRHKAAQLFRQSWKPYWLEPYGLTKEWPQYVDGNYLTNEGSLLMAATMGFTGLRIVDGDWAQYPATLPEGWNRITIQRVWVRGKPMKMVAENGKKAVLTAAADHEGR